MVKTHVEIAYLYKLEKFIVIVLKQLEWHSVVKVTHNTACNALIFFKHKMKITVDTTSVMYIVFKRETKGVNLLAIHFN